MWEEILFCGKNGNDSLHVRSQPPNFTTTIDEVQEGSFMMYNFKRSCTLKRIIKKVVLIFRYF